MFDIIRVLLEKGSLVELKLWVIFVLKVLLTSMLSLPLPIIQTKVAGGLAMTLHSRMTVSCSSGVSVFPLITMSLAGTELLVMLNHTQYIDI